MEGTHLVDIAENDLLDGIVLQAVTHDTAVSTADDQHLLGVGVTRQGKMGDHLLVPIISSATDMISQSERRTRIRHVQCTG